MEEIRQFFRTRQKANLVMVAVNIVVFIILSFMGNTESGQFLYRCGAAYTPAILEGEYFRLVTAMFLHFGVYHLVNNMICLLFLGDMLEANLGPVRYLIIFFVGGILGNAASMAMDLRTGRYAVSAGASGAVFAVMGAMLCILLMRRRENRSKSDGSLTQRFLLMSALSLVQGFTEQGTDNAAHLGGFVCGLALGFLFYRRRVRTGS